MPKSKYPTPVHRSLATKKRKLSKIKKVDEPGLLRVEGTPPTNACAEAPKTKAKKKGGSRCSGHCCRSFSIAYSPEDLRGVQRPAGVVRFWFRLSGSDFACQLRLPW